MKKTMMLLLCCFLLAVPTPVHAAAAHILIRSKQVPYLFLIDVAGDQKLNVYILPEDLYLPNDHATMLNIKKETTNDILSRIEDSYQIPIDSYLEIDLDRIDEDFSVDQKDYDLSCMDGITAYFVDVKENLEVQDILHYQRYITSNLNLNDYYSFYRMFQQSVKIEYFYAPFFDADGRKYPLAKMPHEG